MLVVMDKSTHEEHLYQPLQTNNKQFKIAVTFLAGYNGIFNITTMNDKFLLLPLLIMMFSVTSQSHKALMNENQWIKYITGLLLKKISIK